MRHQQQRGAALVMITFSMVAIMGVAGMTIDGSRGYVLHRQMQSAADAAALAGARSLDRYQRGLTTDAATVATATATAAAANGAAGGQVTCTIVSFGGAALGPCPASGGMMPSGGAGVRVTAGQTQPTGFARILNVNFLTASASATAEIGKPGGADAPFMLCASDPQTQGVAPLSAGGSAWTVNPAAIGKSYTIWGNDVKNYDCGDGSNSFRGLVDQGTGPFSLPGAWPSTTGNKTGPTLQVLGSGTPCDANYTVNCTVEVPMCPYASADGASGHNFSLYCTDMGLFQVTAVNAPKSMTATFLGAAVLDNASGGISGPADPYGARVIVLTS